MVRIPIRFTDIGYNMLDTLQSIYNLSTRGKTVDEMIKRFETQCIAYQPSTVPRSLKKKKSTVSVNDATRDYIVKITDTNNVKSLNETLYCIVKQMYDKEMRVLRRQNNFLSMVKK